MRRIAGPIVALMALLLAVSPVLAVRLDEAPRDHLEP